jgi:hypothetical protein
MYGANSKAMHRRDKFTYFAFAGLGINGHLTLQHLPDGTDARAVFAAGGWTPPSIDEMVSSVNRAASLGIEGIDSEFRSLMLRCSDGFGMNLGRGSNTEYFLNVLASWPMLAPLHVAFLALLETRSRLLAERRAASSGPRRQRLEEVLTLMTAANEEITSITVASKMLGIPLSSEAVMPRRIKEKAKKLRKEFGDYFPNGIAR